MPTSKSNNESAKRRIAVYGSLRKGEYNYRENMGEPIATGFIYGADLYSLGAFPCIVRGDKAHSVMVEVYDLPEKLFQSIEAMELGAGYTREPVEVHYDPLALGPMAAEAYFYPAVADWFGKRIESGDWAQRGNAV